MARFDMDQELKLSKNEQYFKRCLLQLLGSADPLALLQDRPRLQQLSRDFLFMLPQTLPEPKHLSLRAQSVGNWRQFIDKICFPYIGEDEVLLERHDRYYPILLHSHDYLELMCVVCGSCWQVAGGQLSRLIAGDVICLPPGTSHSFTSFDDGCVIYNLSIQLDDFEARFYNLLRQETVLSRFLVNTLYTNQHSAYLVFHSGEYLQNENMLADIWQARTEDPALRSARFNVLTELLFLDLLRICGDEIEVHMAQPASVGIEPQILNYIRLRFRTVTLAELSKVFNYSERHISRIVHQSTGMTLGEYLQRFRLEQIAQLLTSTDLSIAAAFDQAGVKNRSYFYRIFRQHFGMTPAQYRAAHSSS